VIAAVNRALQLRGERRRREQLVQTVYEALGSLYESQPPLQQSAAAPAFPTDDLHVNPLTLDRKRRSLTIEAGNGTRSVDVSESETRMLSILMSHPDQVFSCRQLVQQAFGETLDETAAQNIVRPIVSRLRAKLRASGTPPTIHTVRGRGYFLQVARKSPAVK
jgi:DNA-binding response OmpR family regulator